MFAKFFVTFCLQSSWTSEKFCKTEPVRSAVSKDSRPTCAHSEPGTTEGMWLWDEWQEMVRYIIDDDCDWFPLSKLNLRYNRIRVVWSGCCKIMGENLWKCFHFWSIVCNGLPYDIGPLSVYPVCLSVILVYCGQTVRWIKMKLGTEVGLDPGHIVLDGIHLPSLKGHTSLQFSTHICSGQTAGWIKMSLPTNVGLGPRHIVLDGDPAVPAPSPPPDKRGHGPNFRPMFVVAKRLDGSRCHLVWR